MLCHLERCIDENRRVLLTNQNFRVEEKQKVKCDFLEKYIREKR